MSEARPPHTPEAQLRPSPDGSAQNGASVWRPTSIARQIRYQLAARIISLSLQQPYRLECSLSAALRVAQPAVPALTTERCGQLE